MNQLIFIVHFLRVTGLMLFTLLGMVVFFPPILLAAPSMTDKAKFYLEGMFNERERLKSGIVHIEFEERALSEKEIKRKSIYTIAFDIDNNLLHFYQTHPVESYYYIRNKEYTFCYFNNDGMVYKRDHSWLKKEPQETSVFDVRCLGIAESTYFMIRHTFDELKNKKLNAHFLDLKENQSGIHQIVFETNIPGGTSKMKTTETIDTNRGFLPIHSQTVLVTQANPIDKEPVVFSNQTDWIKLNGIWLPEMEKNRQFHAKTEYIIHYKWEKINETIENSWFSLESMQIGDGVLLADVRLGGTPIIEGTFKDGKLELSGEAALAAMAAEAQTATAKRMFRIRMFLMSIGLILIAYAVYTKIKKYRATKSKNISETTKNFTQTKN